MAKYKLCVLGWGMEGCTHTLTNEEVQKLRDYKDKNSHNEYSEMYSELPEILESFEHGDTNWWTASRPYVNSSLRFVLKNENDEVVWETPHTETSDVYELDEKYGLPKDFENLMESIDAYPHDGHENILCVIEDVKGTLCNYIIESDEVPVLKISDLPHTLWSHLCLIMNIWIRCSIKIRSWKKTLKMSGLTENLWISMYSLLRM